MQHYLLFKNTCGQVTLNKNKATIALSQNLKNIKDNSSSLSLLSRNCPLREPIKQLQSFLSILFTLSIVPQDSVKGLKI